MARWTQKKSALSSHKNKAKTTLNKATFCVEPASQRDAGASKINGMGPLTLPQKFLGLFNQRVAKLRRNKSAICGWRFFM
jgi:hypothetical protein